MRRMIPSLGSCSRLPTHRLQLDEVTAGVGRLARGDAIRQVVVFPE